jgi:dolichol-phosphate mannosyltransferase
MALEESTLVALATYNEIDNLPTLIDAVHEQLPKATVVVIDDNSPDGTGQWCDEKVAVAPWFSCLHRPEKLGLGTALRTAMQTAVERDVESLITMDADWSHPPEVLPRILEMSNRADVVIGSRYCPGGGIEGWPLRRRMASRLINSASRNLLGVPVRDCSGNYRLYSTQLLRQIHWEDIRAEGYAYIEEVLWHLHLLNARFAEVPITFVDRQAGESKISSAEMVGAARMLTRLAGQRAAQIFRRKT